MKKNYKLWEILSVSIFKKTFDSTQALFNAISLLRRNVRWVFYFLLIFSVTLSMYFISYFVDLNNYSITKIYANELNSLGFIILGFVFLIVSSILGYESIIQNNIKIDEIEEYLNNQKNKKQQWWRLQNMHLFFRIVSYFTIWFTSIQVYYYVVIGFIIKYTNQFQNKSEAIVFLDENMNLFTVGITMLITILIVSTELKIRKTKKEK